MRICIFSHEQPILSTPHSNRCIQIPTFEFAIKSDVLTVVITISSTV